MLLFIADSICGQAEGNAKVCAVCLDHVPIKLVSLFVHRWGKLPFKRSTFSIKFVDFHTIIELYVSAVNLAYSLLCDVTCSYSVVKCFGCCDWLESISITHPLSRRLYANSIAD